MPVLPVLPFGLTPRFTAYPGTITLRTTVYMDIVHDILEGLFAHGFRRILLLSGHVGNAPAQDAARDWQRSHADTQILFHGCIAEPSVWALARNVDADTGHASWIENFPWTQVAGAVPPEERKPMVDPSVLRVADAAAMRDLLGDGSFGGPYAMPEDTMDELWVAAVAGRSSSAHPRMDHQCGARGRVTSVPRDIRRTPLLQSAE